MEEEKIYTFTIHEGYGKTSILRVKESELEDSQKDLLLGTAIKAYQDLPIFLRKEFYTYLDL